MRAVCDFCGMTSLVAVSEQGRRSAAICLECAHWAAREIEDAAAVAAVPDMIVCWQDGCEHEAAAGSDLCPEHQS